MTEAVASRVTEDQELEQLRQMARSFFAAEGTPNIERWERQQQLDRDFWNKAGAVGLLCAAIPTEYGGGGGTFAHDVVIFEEQARAMISGFGNAVHSSICAPYILNYGSEEQRRRWLPGMATGELVCAIAMTEPGTGSDLQAIQTKAIRDGDDYVISGAKTFISNGQHADLVIVAAKTDPDAAAAGVSLIMVETKGLKGFERGRNLEKIGMKSQDTSELFFDEARVPAANLLGDAEGQGFYQLMQQLPQERLVIAVAAVAAMEGAVELALAYTRERTAFGKEIIKFQNTRFELAECKTEATIARIFLDECIHRHLAGELDVATAAMAKYWCTDKQCEIIDRCLQLFGGYGYMLEYPIAKAYVDSRAQRIYGGTNEIMKELIARTL